MWFIYFLCIVVALMADYTIAKKFSDIAEMKGHEGKTYFWFTFIFGMIGMLMVIALPNLRTIQVKNASISKPITRSMDAPKGAPVEKKGEVPAEASLAEKLSYALRFQTDDGMIQYLKNLDDETIVEILEQPKHLIRGLVEKTLSEL